MYSLRGSDFQIIVNLIKEIKQLSEQRKFFFKKNKRTMLLTKNKFSEIVRLNNALDERFKIILRIKGL